MFRINVKEYDQNVLQQPEKQTTLPQSQKSSTTPEKKIIKTRCGIEVQQVKRLDL